MSAPSGQKMVKIVLRGQNGEEHHVELGSEDVVIGRESGCQIQIEDPLISRRHARVGWRIVTEDLGSTNGMWKEGRRLQSAVLEPDQPITLGRGEKFVLTVEGQAARTSEPEGKDPVQDTLRDRERRIENLEREIEELRRRPPFATFQEVQRRLEESQKTIAEQEARIEQLKQGTIFPADGPDVEREELQRALEKAKQSLRDRDRRIETLERDFENLRDQTVAADVHEQLTLELEKVRSQARKFEAQAMSSRETRLDMPAEDSSSAIENTQRELERAQQRIRELEEATLQASAADTGLLAEKESKIGELERKLRELEGAAHAKPSSGEEGRRASSEGGEEPRAPRREPEKVRSSASGSSVGAALADAIGRQFLAGYELEPRDSLLDDTVLLLSRLHHIASATDESITRAIEDFRGVLMPLASMVPEAGKGYLATVREFLLFGTESSRRELTSYLGELETRSRTLMEAYGKGAELWLRSLMDQISPRVLRREARLSEEGRLAGRHASRLWSRYEGFMRNFEQSEATRALHEYVAKAIISIHQRS